MEIVLTSLVFVTALLCVGTMGFAIQRGGTCTVAAVDEVITKRSYNGLAAIIEAAVWVSGGLLVAQALNLLTRMPGGYAVTGWTVLGGALLGLGAFVNRACVFGAIARFGNGEWAYLATPVGFYFGCLTVGQVFSLPARTKLPSASPVFQAAMWGLVAFALFVAWRLSRAFLALRDNPSGKSPVARLRGGLAAHVWAPHSATRVIGITFLVTLLLVGSWAYTDLLADAARGMASNQVARSALLLALLGGAVLGGWTAGKFGSTRVSAARLLRCFAGGALLGWGSLLVPGSNDGLLLVGMPLLWPYAWIAFAAMCLTIAAALSLRRAFAAAPAAHGMP